MFRHYLSTFVFWFACCLLCSVSFCAETEEILNAGALSRAFRDAANEALPATVKIISYLQTAEEREAMLIQVPALKEFKQKRMPGDSTGTGVLVDPAGIVVTNNHVVAKAREIEVELPDGRKYYASKYRHDPETDLAVIWLHLEDENEMPLPFVRFGDSDQMDIGDWVLAIGNPFELDSTVSAGIISAKGRSLKHIQRTEFLQTDAAINPGNSGGPLINLKGEMIGINTAILSQSGAYQGIGFALPSNNAQWVVQQIISKGKVDRAWIGLVTAPVTPTVAKRLGVKAHSGVVVDYALPGSPAEEAQLQADDVILSFDDQPVQAVYQLQRYSERAELGRNHRVVFIRDKKRYAVEIEPKALPASARSVTGMLGSQIRSHVDNSLGLLVVQSTEAMTSRLKMGSRKGVLVLSTVPGARAEKAGIHGGMLIVRVDGKPIGNLNDYVTAREAGSLSDGFRFEIILPGGEEKRIDIKLGK